MSPDGFVPGYLIYLLFIFIPGIGFGELLNLWRTESLAERIALAFALGLSVDAIAMLVKTSGSFGLVGISVDSIYLVIALGLAALIVSVAMKRKVAFPVRPTRMDLTLFVIMILQGMMLLVYFEKYPIFPEVLHPGSHCSCWLCDGVDLGIDNLHSEWIAILWSALPVGGRRSLGWGRTTGCDSEDNGDLGDNFAAALLLRLEEDLCERESRTDNNDHLFVLGDGVVCGRI